MLVPRKNKDYVLSFCRRLVVGSRPIYVDHKPIKECFSIVPEHIATHGGKQKFGWAIHERKRVWLEAEFHVVWERENGTLIDLTPRELPADKILFLHDPERKYEGVQVKSIFYPLTKDPRIKRFIKLTDEHFIEMNKGDLANIQRGNVNTPGTVELGHEIQRLAGEIAAAHGMG